MSLETPPPEVRATILILEDDASMSLLETRKLERAGYLVRQATSVDEARRLIESGGGVDLILLDYQLSQQQSGLEFYRELQKAGHDLPAILVTGFTDEERLAEAMRAGVRDFIPKTEGALDLVVPTVERVIQQVRSERRLAENEARRQMDERFRTSVENMLDPFGIYTAVRGEGSEEIVDFVVDYVNRAACEQARYPCAEMIGRSMLGLFPAFAATGLFAAFAQVVKTGEPFVAESYLIDAPARVAREGRRWFSFSVAKLGGGVTAVWRDVTARKEAEIALEGAKAEAEEANHAKDRFLAALSHELRTPLTPVLALVSAMEADPRMDTEVRENAATIRRNIELEARLIDDILDVTRIIRGKMEMKRQETDLRPIIEHVAKMVSEFQAAPRNVTCHYELAEGPHLARVDAARITQVFWNLLTNAVKFTPAGGQVSLRSHIEPGEGETNEARLTIEIRDTGIGMEKGMLGQIFKPFEQGEKGITRKFGGLGLGLTISRAIVERHGGTLTADSDGRDCGATFTISLPRLSPTPQEKRGAALREARPEPAGGGNGPLALDRVAGTRLLLVEDHRDTGDVLARMLRRAGYEVTVATTVREALTVADERATLQVPVDEKRRAPFDLLVSDIGLPDGTGHELIRELRARHHMRGIALSGFGMEEDLAKSREAGFARHLTKPADLGTLKAAIRDVLSAPA